MVEQACRPDSVRRPEHGSGVTMPYLTTDADLISRAWEQAAAKDFPLAEPVLELEQQLDYGRRAVVVHVPQSWPHGHFCHNCGHQYPCRIVLWGMRLLQARGWDLPSVIDLIEAIQAGERL